MKKTSRQMLLGTTLLFSSSIIQAQSSFVGSGGDIEMSSGSSSYTVGQVFYPTTDSEEITLNPLIQIPYEINVVLSIAKEEQNFAIHAYPNPFNGEIALSLENDDMSDMEYVVTDMYGVTVASGQISTSQTEIDLTTIDAGAYILSVKKGVTELKNIKLVKQ